MNKEKQKQILIDIMEADAKDGLYKQQTAVEWLKEKVKETYNKESKLPIGYVLNLISQAKAMEAEQIVDAHIEGQRVFDKHDHTEWTNDKAEQYYSETYKK